MEEGTDAPFDENENAFVDEFRNESRTGSCGAPWLMDSASFERKSQSLDIVRASPGAALAPLGTRAPHSLRPTDEACATASVILMPSLPASSPHLPRLSVCVCRHLLSGEKHTAA